jgi:membrane protease subunit (stomatin/prohibitin family)
MGIWNAVKRQLRSVIEWQNPAEDDLFFQWTDNGDEIKNVSKLIVGPGQGCIFVYQGEVKSIILEQGVVDLSTENIPFWTTIKKFMQGFESEHKVGIYFFKTTRILDQKWGTTSTIKYEDPTYKIPMGLRAYGNYSFKISNPGVFFSTVTGAKKSYSTEDLRQVISARIIQPLTDFFAEAQFSYTEIDANREELAKKITEKLFAVFSKLGFVITDFRIEGTSFDADTMQRINRIADVSAETHAASAAGLNYTQLQQLEAMKDAAKNEGGAAGIGMGLGAGMGFGQMLANTMTEKTGLPPSDIHSARTETIHQTELLEKLKTLKELLEMDLIDSHEFKEKKRQILDSF